MGLGQYNSLGEYCGPHTIILPPLCVSYISNAGSWGGGGGVIVCVVLGQGRVAVNVMLGQGESYCNAGS